MKARCKFNVQSVTDFGGNQRRINLAAICDSSVPEDQAFTKYTPNGNIEISITNPAAFGVFVPGKQVYVDFLPIEDPPA